MPTPAVPALIAMSGNDPNLDEITGLLHQLDEAPASRRQVLDRLLPLVYDELKALAQANRYRWRGYGAAPGTTSLVHEAYVKLEGQAEASYAGRRQFYSVASKAMRSILIDNARWHQRQKRGGGAEHVPVVEDLLVSAERGQDILDLDEALTLLEENEPGLARIVECRCFGGLTNEETAHALDVSTATVKRRWSLARAWLYRELRAESV